jgi:hypothetical protein
MSRPAERVVAFYNKEGTGEQWIKDGKGAIKWTRLSCRTFAANVVRLQLYALAYKDVGNVGSHPPLACGLPTSSENSYHPRQFRIHLGDPGEHVQADNGEGVETPRSGRTLSMEPAVELEIKPRTDVEPYLTPVRCQIGP